MKSAEDVVCLSVSRAEERPNVGDVVHHCTDGPALRKSISYYQVILSGSP